MTHIVIESMLAFRENFRPDIAKHTHLINIFPLPASADTRRREPEDGYQFPCMDRSRSRGTRGLHRGFFLNSSALQHPDADASTQSQAHVLLRPVSLIFGAQDLLPGH